MTFFGGFHDWQRDASGFENVQHCSPALQELRTATGRRWGTVSLGCLGARAVRGGAAPSSHSYGAAIDLSYRAIGAARARTELLPYLLAWSGEWGIQAVHDYVGCRIWRAGRTEDHRDACGAWWKAQRPDAFGMGQDWAEWYHVEVHPWMWANGADERTRGIT